MNPLHQTPTDPRRQERLPGDLDQALRDFFRAEMPEPWPGFQAPETSQIVALRSSAPRRFLFRSRFALAASLLLLLLGHLMLSGTFSDYLPPAGDQGTGQNIGSNPHGHKQRKVIPPAQPQDKQHSQETPVRERLVA